MKRMLAYILCLLMTLSMIPAAHAEGEGWYIVASTKPDGYCYLYSAASDRAAKSSNLGPYKNGELVYVLDYYGGQDGSYNYCRVQTMDGKTGYMHDYALVRYYGTSSAEATGEGWYMVASTKPDGYCYLYSAASDRAARSSNLGPYENGELVYVLDYYGGQDGSYNYCHVRTMDGKTGYMHDYSLVRYYGTSAAETTGEGWYMVASTKPDGYCYLYSAPSDRAAKSSNLGPCQNGELVYVLDYYGGQDGSYNYCHVRTMDGKTGYMHDYALVNYLSYLQQFYAN